MARRLRGTEGLADSPIRQLDDDPAVSFSQEGVMTFPEAIRLGSMLAPQGFGTNVTADGHTCAIGAAKAAGMNIDEMYRVLGQPAPPCPQCEYQSHHQWARMELVFHLNDNHRWTREAIAQFMEMLETPVVEETEEALVLA